MNLFNHICLDFFLPEANKKGKLNFDSFQLATFSVLPSFFAELKKKETTPNPGSKMILGGRLAYRQNPPPKSLSNDSIGGDSMCL